MNSSPKQVEAKAAARVTHTAPAQLGEASKDVLANQHAHQQQTSAAMPFNVNKMVEYGQANALTPSIGDHHKVPLDAGASTLSEQNISEKTGQAANPGNNAAVKPLEDFRADSAGQSLTTNQGVLVADNQNSLKAGLRGPSLLEDFILREKITHFDHERITERIVHARGSAAHGYFEAYEALNEYTRASPFSEAGKITPVFVRFSTVAGERGSADTVRDVRGFAVKFYTDQGNWDLVGNNMPVFFIQDAMKFPDLVHALKPEPHHAMPQASSAHDTFWDFVSLMPESAHMLLWVMSDRALPRSYRMMQGFGVHTFRLVNAKGESHFVKFHWTPKLGTHSLVWDEAVKLQGADSDFHRRDLWEAIEAGEYPEWELGLQIFTEQQAEEFSFDILDATKIIPEELVPVKPVGRLVLNRNPDNFFSETEQVAFCTAHVIPGIDFSNDPLLAGRIHSYVDTQLTRLGGPNFHEIPINAPVVQIHNNQRDGLHRQTINRGRVAYEPNSLAGGCPFQAGKAGFVSFPQPVQEDKVRGKPEKFADHYTQATLFWESQSEWEKDHIASAFRFELSKLTVPAIRERVLALLVNVAPELASRVAQGLGVEVPAALPKVLAQSIEPEIERSEFLSLTAFAGEPGIRTRKIALLIANGVEAKALRTLHKTLLEQGAVPVWLAPKLGAVNTQEGEVLQATATLENSPAMLFDAVVLPSGSAAVYELAQHDKTQEFILNQYWHGKTLLVLGEGQQLLENAKIALQLASGEADPGIVLAQSKPSFNEAHQRFIQALQKHKHYERMSAR